MRFTQQDRLLLRAIGRLEADRDAFFLKLERCRYWVESWDGTEKRAAVVLGALSDLFREGSVEPAKADA